MGIRPYRFAGSLLWLALFDPQAGRAFDAPRIPQEHSQSLAGQIVELPGAFAGRRGVLVVGFSQESRDQVTAWGKLLSPDFAHSADVAYFQVAQFAGVPRILRGWVIKKVKASVPERAQAHFLVVTEHESEWKSITGYASADDAYVIVIDSSGAVRWKTHGAPTDAAYADLKQHLR